MEARTRDCDRDTGKDELIAPIIIIIIVVRVDNFNYQIISPLLLQVGSIRNTFVHLRGSPRKNNNEEGRTGNEAIK